MTEEKNGHHSNFSNDVNNHDKYSIKREEKYDKCQNCNKYSTN